jgi:hypothetical protein
MKTMKKVVLISAVLLAFIGVSLFVPAGTAMAYLIDHPHSQGVGYADVSFDGGASTVEAYLGRFLMELAVSAHPPAVPGAPLPPLPSNYPTYPMPIYSSGSIIGYEKGFFSYCIEPLQSIGVGHGTVTNFTIGPLAGAGAGGISAAEALLIGELFGRYSPLLSGNPDGPSTGLYTGGTFRTAAAALQLAIWKINLDTATETLGSWDFASGLMRVATGAPPLETGASLKADAVALAMLNSLTGSGPMAYLESLRNDTVQDLLIQPVPIPAAAWLLGTGIVGLVGIRRKFRK